MRDWLDRDSIRHGFNFGLGFGLAIFLFGIVATFLQFLLGTLTLSGLFLGTQSFSWNRFALLAGAFLLILVAGLVFLVAALRYFFGGPARPPAPPAPPDPS